MGFPDGHTDVPHKGKPAADSARYKALGNSWAVNCARWIGERSKNHTPHQPALTRRAFFDHTS